MSDYMTNTGFRLKRSRSGDLWLPLNVDALRSDPTNGFFCDFDFVRPGDITSFAKVDAAAGAGTFANVAGNFGVADLRSTASTQHHGAQIQLGTSTFGMVTPTAGGIYAMEVIGTFTASTLPYFVMGLSTASATPVLSATSTVTATADFVGMAAVSTIGQLTSGYRVSSGTAAFGSSFKTIVTAQPVKLGLRITGTSLVEFWVNGLKQSSTYDLATVPTAIMSPVIGITAGGAAATSFKIDYLAIGWNYSPTTIVET